MAVSSLRGRQRLVRLTRTLRLADGGPYADLALTWRKPASRRCRRSTRPGVVVCINAARRRWTKSTGAVEIWQAQPVPVSSRCYSIRDKHFRFAEATPAQVEEFVARKVFWGSGSERQPVLIAILATRSI